jgi:hypothetical protein
MNNLAFELAILLPATSIVVTRVNWGVAAFSLMLALSLPSFVLYQPFAGWLVYAPAPAQQITNEIQSAPGPVLLGRRQEFLLRTGRPVYDDIGDIYFEFVPAGYPQAAARLNREIRSGKYALLMMEPDEFQEMEESTRQFLTSNYRVSADPARAIFQLRLTKLH